VNAVDAIGASPPRRDAAVSGLSSDEFFRLIFAELTTQDPLKPSDTGTLLEQVANIRAIQSDEDLSNRLAELAGQNELAAGAGLIGRLVTGVSESDGRVSGLVRSVSRTEAGVVLRLEGGSRVPMRSVDGVVEPDREDRP
jgi:flagellar basal-body rod modification protein FlgD